MSEFHAILEVERLTDYLDTLQSVDNESTFYFREDGIYTQPTDPSAVACVNQTLKPSAFESYETTGYTTGINIERFQDFLDAGDGSDLVELTLDPETRKIQIVLPDAESTEFTMACIDPESVRNGQDISETGLMKDDGANIRVDVTMDVAALTHSLSVMDKVTDHVEITADPDRDNPLHFIGSGDTDDALVRFGNSLHEGSKVHGSTEAMYSIEYLEDLSGVMPKSVPVRLRFGSEWPMLLEHSDPEGHREVRMMLGPRIDNS